MLVPGVGRCYRHRLGSTFGGVIARRHSPAVKFDPPGLYQPRTIEDPLAMIEPVSLEELCRDGKPIYIAALRVDDRTIDRSRTRSSAFQCTGSRSTNWRLSVSISMNAFEQDSFGHPWQQRVHQSFFARKKDGGLRMCTDYRELNAKSLKNRYPLPLVDNILHRLAGAKLFIELDQINTYHRVENRLPHAAGYL